MIASRVTYTIHETRRLVETTVREGFTYGDIAAIFAALRTDPRVRADFDRLAIYEASATRLSAAQIRDMIEAARAVSHGPTTRIAIVVPDDVTFGIMRMYELYGEAGGATVRVFRSRAEADAWLRGRARSE